MNQPQAARFVARIYAYDDHGRPVLPDQDHLKLLDFSPEGMADAEDFLNGFLERLVRDDGTRPRPDLYRLVVHDNSTGMPVTHWRYAPRIER